MTKNLHQLGMVGQSMVNMYGHKHYRNLPNNTRGKDLIVVLGKNTLKVGLKAAGDGGSTTTKGEGPIVDNKIYKTIIVDDSFWTIEDGNRLVLTLTKSNQIEWWECVCIGDPTINLQKVQPENRSLNDLDGETRQTVEKMMYDQRQKALVLPTAEEATNLRYWKSLNIVILRWILVSANSTKGNT